MQLRFYKVETCIRINNPYTIIILFLVYIVNLHYVDSSVQLYGPMPYLSKNI